MDTFEQSITQADLWHWPVPGQEGDGWHKEWYHFTILAPSVRVILNLSISGDTRATAPREPDARLARVILMTHDGVWNGDVDSIASRDVHVARTSIDLRLGQNWVRFQDGTFELSAALQNQPVTLKASLRPAVPALQTKNNAPLGGGSINWLVVPRLSATGVVTIGRAVHHFKDAPSYHDHNWGRWLWGQDFAWQWGFGLPQSGRGGSAWSVVFYNITDRRRFSTQDQTLGIWQDGRLRRVFARHEIKVRPSGYLGRLRVSKYPRVMALVAPENTTDVPHHLEIAAVTGGDEVHVRFEAEDVAQIVVPNETDLGSTLINQVTGRLTLEGHVDGEKATIEGEGLFEFLTP